MPPAPDRPRGHDPAPADAPRLEVADLAVAYGDLVAVDGVDLRVAAGEVVALLGPSGCGKSSLLHAVAGLVPSRGRVLVDGRDVAGLRPDQRGLGLMFQHGALFPHLDVAANVGFGLRMQGWPAARRSTRVDDVLDLVGLAGLGGRRVDALSGGQAQRAALARAIAPNPSLLLLDEPLSSLDRRLRDRLIAELPAVFATVDAAVVHVTHDQDEAMALADRLAIMRAGRVVRRGTPTQVWDDPGSVFVASFLGWANVFTADDGTTGLPRAIRDRLATTGAVGVDAGRVHVAIADRGGDAAAGADTGATTWPGRVVERRFAGDHVAVDVVLDGTPDGGTTVLRSTGPVHASPAPGDAVTVTIADDAWRTLDPDGTDPGANGAGAEPPAPAHGIPDDAATGTA